ncbi:Saccharopine dehydrogenase [Halalkaliarchaeum sp. AArc-CO]|uniref:saccharopine dehydrogenase family protein n=1 Tax=unclassified Halalkaliarchaeum TaxID=2678344 RepID=UPI00217E33BE|nr:MULTISPECIES: saccharopine dehydrogenase NADP-binding domain-containing protein [unclassified Halalkaliarchaeum]MDR5673499.1 saccharopine dehydrogenase NADP-binding domain-containing protein [Halalkaliarchaeum sp. AArc-GB]UWG49815.1 Saccharopine dehydrogenase [Halalkaliarchaeum sp. AArc-CO]
MTLLIYGAYGYTGELVAAEAVSRDVDVVVAGRDRQHVAALADRIDCDGAVFGLDSGLAGDAADSIVPNLEGVDAVLNCAGPFVDTYRPLVEACLRTGTHYLDVTGEIPVFEAIAARDAEAAAAGVCLLPGVGFDVVPTDCLARHLYDRLPTATRLRLGFDPSGTVSRGTLATAIEQFEAGGKRRRDGEIVDVPVGRGRRRIDFGRGERNAVLAPMGDLSTAYRSTGIENVAVYLALPRSVGIALRFGRFLSPILGAEPVKRGLQRLVRATVTGPSKTQRETGACYVWGEATDGDRTVTSRLKTPETYAFTVDAATTAAQRLLDSAPGDGGEGPAAGFQTPATAFGPEFVLELGGVEGFFDE